MVTILLSILYELHKLNLHWRVHGSIIVVEQMGLVFMSVKGKNHVGNPLPGTYKIIKLNGTQQV